MHSRSSLSIVIPAYNESARIEPALRAMLAFLDVQQRRAEVIVVDDGSRDDTCAVVGRVTACDERVRLMRLPANRGKGYAVRAGVVNAVGSRILFADADGATPAEELERLEYRMDRGADVVIGSRALRGSGVQVRAKATRRVIGRVFHQLVRQLTVVDFADTQCGFKLFTAPVAQELFSRMRMDGFSFDVELLMIACRHGFTVAEEPVNWTHQRGSKVRVVRDGLKMSRDLFRIHANALRGLYDRPHIAARAAVLPAYVSEIGVSR